MLLIDGVKYELWTPNTEEEFENIMKEHTQEIFGQQSIYIDRKQKLKSLSGIGSIPDGYVIILGDTPQWHIVEAELSSHPLDQHIVAQVSRFITGIKNPNTQRDIVGAMYNEITKDNYLKLKIEEAIKPTETYKFLSDLISKPPVLTIIIEQDTEGLREAISTLAHSDIKIVEFQTFVRKGVGLSVHAHLFEPIVRARKSNITKVEVQVESTVSRIPTMRFTDRVTVGDLLDARILNVGQAIYGWHRGQKYEARIFPDGITLPDGRKFKSLSMAAFRGIVGHQVNGWNWWRTTREDNTECVLEVLRQDYRNKLSQLADKGKGVSEGR